jgi:acylphosphatase
MTERRVVHLSIRGRVQGVGFRAFVEDEAVARQLDGWVRNRRDGSVEAAGAGPHEAVDSWIEAVRQGPPASRVDALEVRETEESALAGRFGFAQLPTV